MAGTIDSQFKPDCARCCGLCCVAPAFAASSEFAIDKPAGRPCPHLMHDFRCDIHDRLRGEGFGGCVAYDCFGAGQKITQVTFGGADWRRSRADAELMFAAFQTMRQIHSLLMHLSEAISLPGAEPLRAELQASFDALEALSNLPAGELIEADMTPSKLRANELLTQASKLVRHSPEP